MTDPRVLLLDERDNILVLRAPVAPGDVLGVEGRQYRMTARLPLGHKIARCAIRPGERVLKYGAPIGVATAAIAAGAHVHLHNLRSDYTPSYVLPADRPGT